MPVSIRRQSDGSLLLKVKAVPGSSRDKLLGEHGDALRVAISAPPEGGRANKAVCKLLAGELGLPARDLTVHAGASRPFKTVRIVGLDEPSVRARLAL